MIKKKRLFITTGIVSIINAMSICDMDNGFQNHLYVLSRVQNDSFIKNNNEIILPNYFSKIVFDTCPENYENPDFLNQFDIVYITNQPKWRFLEFHHNVHLFEEGISSYCHFPNANTKNLKGGVLRNYLDHIFYINKDIQITKQSKEITRRIIKKINARNLCDFSSIKKEKQVLLLAQYIYERIFDSESVVSFYKKHIDSLLAKGYSVLFKSHPRIESRTYHNLESIYKNNDRVDFLDNYTKLPAEIITMNFDFLMSVSSMSGAGISIADLYQIPNFAFGTNIIGEYPLNNYVNFYKSFYLNFIPHIKNALKFSADDENIRDLLKSEFYDFLGKSNDWRNDDKIIAAHNKYIGGLL